MIKFDVVVNLLLRCDNFKALPLLLRDEYEALSFAPFLPRVISSFFNKDVTRFLAETPLTLTFTIVVCGFILLPIAKVSQLGLISIICTIYNIYYFFF